MRSDQEKHGTWTSICRMAVVEGGGRTSRVGLWSGLSMHRASRSVSHQSRDHFTQSKRNGVCTPAAMSTNVLEDID